jgi:threonine dehydrogenase-like Zn-dependent dehydrogenase
VETAQTWAIECSGAARAAKTLSDVASRGGRFCQMGLYGKAIPFDQDAVCYKELVVTGTNARVDTSTEAPCGTQG